MPISAGSVLCPLFTQDSVQHRRNITQWMVRVSPFLQGATLPDYANDAAAAAGGVAVGSPYRNGSALMVRIA